MANSQLHLILQVCSNTSHWLLYKLAYNGQAQVHFGWRTWCARLSELHDIWAHHSAFCHFSWVSNECTHGSSTITIQSRKTLPSFFQHCRWDMARRTYMALWSSLSMCGIHFAQISHFPKLLVKIWQTLARDILTSVTIAKHEILHACSRTHLTCSMWHSSVADVGATLQGTLSLYRHSWRNSPSSEQFHMKEHVSLNLPSMTCNTLELFYPTKYEILWMFSQPAISNLLVVFLDPQLNSNWHHKDSAALRKQQ